MKFTVAIISGGNSRRFGSDKTLAPLLGRPLVDWVAGGAKLVSDDVVIIAKDVDKYNFIDGVRIEKDICDKQCSIVGLLSAAEYAKYDVILLISADMPRFNFAVSDVMIGCLTPQTDAVIPCVGGKYYPLAAMYRRRVRKHFKKMLDGGDLRFMNALAAINKVILGESELACYNEDGSAFVNVNTEEDLQGLASLLGRSIKGGS